mmetsp:Transcript_3812/g.13549  ORF Transcript_3812/g.13549 Transcript_3812/m.13549 type:complete len:257 (-) Transcript_3812:80-850(-)
MFIKIIRRNKSGRFLANNIAYCGIMYPCATRSTCFPFATFSTYVSIASTYDRSSYLNPPFEEGFSESPCPTTSGANVSYPFSCNNTETCRNVYALEPKPWINTTAFSFLFSLFFPEGEPRRCVHVCPFTSICSIDCVSVFTICPVEESNVSLYVALSSSSPSSSSAALTIKLPATFPLEAVEFLLFVLLLGKTPPNIRSRVVVIEDDDDDDVDVPMRVVAFVVIIISKEYFIRNGPAVLYIKEIYHSVLRTTRRQK